MAVQSTDLVMVERAGVAHKTTAGDIAALGGGGGSGPFNIDGGTPASVPVVGLAVDGGVP
jgi:hypothetical protein